MAITMLPNYISMYCTYAHHISIPVSFIIFTWREYTATRT